MAIEGGLLCSGVKLQQLQSGTLTDKNMEVNTLMYLDHSELEHISISLGHCRVSCQSRNHTVSLHVPSCLSLQNQTRGIVMVNFYNDYVTCSKTAKVSDVAGKLNRYDDDDDDDETHCKPGWILTVILYKTHVDAL